MAQHQRRLGVDVDEDDLADGHGWLELGDQFDDAGMQPADPFGQLAFARADDATGDVAHRVATGVDQPEAGDAQAGVDAKNAHEESEWQVAILDPAPASEAGAGAEPAEGVVVRGGRTHRRPGRAWTAGDGRPCDERVSDGSGARR